MVGCPRIITRAGEPARQPHAARSIESPPPRAASRRPGRQHVTASGEACSAGHTSKPSCAAAAAARAAPDPRAPAPTDRGAAATDRRLGRREHRQQHAPPAPPRQAQGEMMLLARTASKPLERPATCGRAWVRACFPPRACEHADRTVHASVRRPVRGRVHARSLGKVVWARAGAWVATGAWARPESRAHLDAH